MPLADSVLAALKGEALQILTRIASDPNNKAIVSQFEQRLAHLAEKLGEQAFAALVDQVKSSAAAAPPPVPQGPPKS